MTTAEIIVPVRLTVEVDYDRASGVLTITMPNDVVTRGNNSVARFGPVFGYNWPIAPEGHVYITDHSGDNDRLDTIAKLLQKQGIVEIVDDGHHGQFVNGQPVALARVLI